ncbi:MAG TPA: hypothetical protein VGY98_13910 [Verrucomicrobiae bacterium]|nr:hypothetical protein [Verrucomicrobiae bacterium]
MKSIVNCLLLAVTLLSVTAALAAPPAIQTVFLDENTAVSLPVATNRVTTISFPGSIEAIDGAGFTVDGKTPGQFQLAHAKGSAFLSVRALASKASANLNVRWNGRTYVFELSESSAPVLSLNMEAMPVPEDAGIGRSPDISPIRLLGLLDKAKAFPLLKTQQPESVADAGFTTYDGKPLVSDFNDYQIRIQEAFRFNAEDTLVFRVAMTNETDAPLVYQPDSFAIRAGNRLYPQSISDADGVVPPRGQSIVYFAVTGTPDGGRNNLSLENPFTVLIKRLSPPPPPVPVTNVPPDVRLSAPRQMSQPSASKRR